MNEMMLPAIWRSIKARRERRAKELEARRRRIEESYLLFRDFKVQLNPKDEPFINYFPVC